MLQYYGGLVILWMKQNAQDVKIKSHENFPLSSNYSLSVNPQSL